jgi:hypothetical protein
LSCGDRTVDATFVAALEQWRTRDVADYPSLRYDGATADAANCDMTVDLSKNAVPFLTADDYCT